MGNAVLFARAVSVMCALLCASVVANAQSVEIKQAWIRGTVPAQKVTGAFMEITGKRAVRLLSANSLVAASVEIHNMTMQNGVMKMAPVDGIDVPAGKTIRLAPGGYHMMLMGLKQQMKPGEHVPMRLTFELADKRQESLDISVEVRDIAGNRAAAHTH